ncbi:MAG TPA: hypothetical protein VNM69_05325 [Bacillus sp. (in: firmicutes)]|uniref:hypothetical protein n=1 Tax=Bacillus litorisediminis TaxID=2922713 RepID=UPI001FAD6ECA|nr:hypothetical protein [Bacillus litorisediminis]HWO75329.1 hypothetical protein [Bacillus sp. (in: firmicutes)]
MDIQELIEKVNQSTDELDFVTARVYIEENLNVLKEKQAKLNSNARELLRFLVTQMESGVKPLSRQELAIINTINAYATKFDMRGIKFLVKDHSKLLFRKEVVDYLNSDAKIILEGMGAISTKSGSSSSV